MNWPSLDRAMFRWVKVDGSLRIPSKQERPRKRGRVEAGKPAWIGPRHTVERLKTAAGLFKSGPKKEAIYALVNLDLAPIKVLAVAPEGRGAKEEESGAPSIQVPVRELLSVKEIDGLRGLSTSPERYYWERVRIRCSHQHGSVPREQHHNTYRDPGKAPN